MKPDNKNILITGGTSGIGLCLVHQLSRQNKVSIIARPSSHLEAFRGSFPDVPVYVADLADIAQVEAAADQILRGVETIDILINNAAVQYTPYFTDDDFRYETIKREIDINFTSICTLTYLLLPNLMKSENATVLNVNSGLAIAPKASSAIYCATKSALDSFTQSLSYQLEHTNISVRQVFLPLVNTAMTHDRDQAKLPAEFVAGKIAEGLGRTDRSFDIGKVKLLRLINRLSPALARSIMKWN